MSSVPLGLIPPLGAAGDVSAIRALVDDRIIESVWVRDLPSVAPDDRDGGQRSDPWWYLGRLHGQGVRPERVGTASIILGVRHPLVVARAAAGAQIDTGGRFVLGLGTGGKPEMNRALGIAGRSYDDFAAEWARLRAALRGVDPLGDEVSLQTPPDYRPPPVHLATSDVKRWEAIDGDADGWQTFLTDDHPSFARDHARVCDIRGAQTDVALRLDVDVVPAAQAGHSPRFTNPARGRVSCTARQLPGLIEPWLGDGVGRILLRLSGDSPEAAVRHLHEHLSA